LKVRGSGPACSARGLPHAVRRASWSFTYQEGYMAQKGGKLKKIILTIILLALLGIVFVLMGGGNMLRTAGKKLEGAGKQADTIKQTVEEKAATIEKKVEKGIESVKPGEKK
jgi:hypothetical protein